MTHASPLATQGNAPTEALLDMVWHEVSLRDTEFYFLYL